MEEKIHVNIKDLPYELKRSEKCVSALDNLDETISLPINMQKDIQHLNIFSDRINNFNTLHKITEIMMHFNVRKLSRNVYDFMSFFNSKVSNYSDDHVKMKISGGSYQQNANRRIVLIAKAKQRFGFYKKKYSSFKFLNEMELLFNFDINNEDEFNPNNRDNFINKIIIAGHVNLLNYVINNYSFVKIGIKLTSESYNLAIKYNRMNIFRYLHNENHPFKYKSEKNRKAKNKHCPSIFWKTDFNEIHYSAAFGDLELFKYFVGSGWDYGINTLLFCTVTDNLENLKYIFPLYMKKYTKYCKEQYNKNWQNILKKKYHDIFEFVVSFRAVKSFKYIYSQKDGYTTFDTELINCTVKHGTVNMIKEIENHIFNFKFGVSNKSKKLELLNMVMSNSRLSHDDFKWCLAKINFNFHKHRADFIDMLTRNFANDNLTVKVDMIVYFNRKYNINIIEIINSVEKSKIVQNNTFPIEITSKLDFDYIFAQGFRFSSDTDVLRLFLKIFENWKVTVDSDSLDRIYDNEFKKLVFDYNKIEKSDITSIFKLVLQKCIVPFFKLENIDRKPTIPLLKSILEKAIDPKFRLRSIQKIIFNRNYPLFTKILLKYTDVLNLATNNSEILEHLNKSDNVKITPDLFLTAINNHNSNSVKYLLREGFDVNISLIAKSLMSNYRNVKCFEELFYYYLKFWKVLEEDGLLDDVSDERKNIIKHKKNIFMMLLDPELFYRAIYSGMYEVVKILLNHPNTKNYDLKFGLNLINNKDKIGLSYDSVIDKSMSDNKISIKQDMIRWSDIELKRREKCCEILSSKLNKKKRHNGSTGLWYALANGS